MCGPTGSIALLGIMTLDNIMPLNPLVQRGWKSSFDDG
jgi:hypothetical protein